MEEKHFYNTIELEKVIREIEDGFTEEITEFYYLFKNNVFEKIICLDAGVDIVCRMTHVDDEKENATIQFKVEMKGDTTDVDDEVLDLMNRLKVITRKLGLSHGKE